MSLCGMVSAGFLTWLDVGMAWFCSVLVAGWVGIRIGRWLESFDPTHTAWLWREVLKRR